MNLDLRTRRTAGLPLLAGTVNGALAYVAGLFGAVVLYVVLGLQPLAALALGPGSGPGLSGAGFAFYGGHLVPVSMGEEWVNFAFEFANNGVVYLLLVVAVLGSTGYYLGGADGLSGGRERALAGATLVVGYLPMAVVGATVFRHEWTSDPALAEAETIVVELPLPIAAVLAGLLVPAVVGAAGGLLAERLAGESVEDEAEPSAEVRSAR